MRICLQEAIRDSINKNGESKVALTFRNMELFEKFTAGATAAAASPSTPSKPSAKSSKASKTLMQEAFV